jgi:hypothetical protein
MRSLAERHLELIDERWKANHWAAMSCRNVEDLVRLSIQTVEWIDREEENWRHSVLSGATSYSEVEERFFATLYDRWLQLCRNFLEPIARLEGQGFVVEMADRFRAHIRETEGLLTPDAQFFAADELVRLRDEAIDEHRRGEGENVVGQG